MRSNEPMRYVRQFHSDSTLFRKLVRPCQNFSSHINTVSEALSIRYNNLVYELQSAGNDIIVLSLGEAFFDLPLYSFDSTPLPSIYHYSHSRGLPELRTLLADYYAGEYGVPVDAKSEIIVTSGSKIAIYMSLLAIIDPGDEVVIHEPAWVSYADQIRLCHGIPVPVPYDVPITEIGRFITSRTKAVVLNYPNNPRGLIMSRQNLGRPARHGKAERSLLAV